MQHRVEGWERVKHLSASHCPLPLLLPLWRRVCLRALPHVVYITCSSDLPFNKHILQHRLNPGKMHLERKRITLPLVESSFCVAFEIKHIHHVVLVVLKHKALVERLYLNKLLPCLPSSLASLYSSLRPMTL